MYKIVQDLLYFHIFKSNQMKKNFVLILSALLLVLLSVTDVDAQYQRSSKKKKKKKPAKTEKEAEPRDDTRRKSDSNLK